MTTIKFRRDTSANWTSVNPIPAQGEPCYETDTGKLKIGNGSDNYVTLPYVSDGGGSSGDLPIATATTLGGVKIGDNLSITEDGTLSASSEAKTVKTPSGRIKLDNGGLHNEDNSRSIINRSSDRLEVTVGNSYEPTIIDGSSIKLNSTNITDRDGNTFLSGDTIKGVKFFQDSGANKNIANSAYTSNRLELTAGACNLYDSDNRQVFGSSYNSGIGKTDWSFASQSDTVRIANKSASTSYGLMLKVPTDGTSPTIGYTYYGTDSSLYGKEQTFLRTEDVDNSTIKIVDGKLTASGGNYIKTTQVSKGGLNYGVYLNSTNGNKLDTIQPKFDTFDGALKTSYIQYLKAATYSSSEPADEDMWNNWTDKNGFLTGLTTPTGFISGSVKFGAGSGSLQVVFKLMEAGYIAGIDQIGNYKFSKIEISTDGTTYTEYNNTTSNAKYIRFTFDYNFTGITDAIFSTRIRTTASNIAGGECKPLSVSVDDKTIKIVNDKLVGNITSDMIDATYMKINDSGKLTVDKAAVAHLAMPSNTKVDLTLGASGTTYTAPADGYVCVGFFGDVGGNFEILAQVSNSVSYVTGAARCQCPVLKGGFSCWYQKILNDDRLTFYFTYAVGTVPTNTEPDF